MARATVAPGSSRAQTSDAASTVCDKPHTSANDILSLPFVRDLGAPRPETGSPRHFWMPACDGLDYLAACDLGQDYAVAALRYMVPDRFSPLFPWAVLDMMGRRADEADRGVIVGFLSTFGEAAMALGPHGVERLADAVVARRREVAALMAAGKPRRRGRADG